MKVEMNLATYLHTFINNYNILKTPTEKLRDYLKEHPNFYKSTLLANHVFRAASMAAFSRFLPCSAPVSAGICFAGSLFYRLSVEINCAYKFALPAFAGSTAFLMGRDALTDVVSGAAFASLGKLSKASASLAPLGLYLSYIVLTVSYDVDNPTKKS